MRFDDFIGNEKALERLGMLLEGGRFPHALLLEGEHGLGKKTLARDLACTLVCRSAEQKPCMQCSQCRKAKAGLHPDVFTYIPSGSANSFHVDTVRDIIADAYIRPNEATYKVYILADAHCMNVAAQNALLKLLEEPPAYVVILLTAQSKSAMLDTILSRCVCVHLEGVLPDAGAKYISSTVDACSYEKAKKTLTLFGGNIGKTLESLQDTRTAELVAVCETICRGLAEGNAYTALCACAALQKDRQAVVFVCDMLKSMFRDALHGERTGEYLSGSVESAALLRAHLSRKRLFQLMETCTQLKQTALTNVNNTLMITKICYSLFSC